MESDLHDVESLLRLSPYPLKRAHYKKGIIDASKIKTVVYFNKLHESCVAKYRSFFSFLFNVVLFHEILGKFS